MNGGLARGTQLFLYAAQLFVLSLQLNLVDTKLVNQPLRRFGRQISRPLPLRPGLGARGPCPGPPVYAGFEIIVFVRHRAVLRA